MQKYVTPYYSRIISPANLLLQSFVSILSTLKKLKNLIIPQGGITAIELRSVAYQRANRDFVRKVGNGCPSVEHISFGDNWRVRVTRCSRRGLVLSWHNENDKYDIFTDRRIKDYPLLTHPDIPIARSNPRAIRRLFMGLFTPLLACFGRGSWAKQVLNLITFSFGNNNPDRLRQRIDFRSRYRKGGRNPCVLVSRTIGTKTCVGCGQVCLNSAACDNTGESTTSSAIIWHNILAISSKGNIVDISLGILEWRSLRYSMWRRY